MLDERFFIKFVGKTIEISQEDFTFSLSYERARPDAYLSLCETLFGQDEAAIGAHMLSIVIDDIVRINSNSTYEFLRHWRVWMTDQMDHVYPPLEIAFRPAYCAICSLPFIKANMSRQFFVSKDFERICIQ